jgi:hypothetical protein
MSERDGPSCTELLNDSPVTRVYAGYQDPTQRHLAHDEFDVVYTQNSKIESVCKSIADCFLKEETPMDPAGFRGESIEENFIDGKHPGRKGLAKRSGVNTKASVSSLRRTAKHSTGEKARMAHWLANMKAGRAKKKK